MRDASSGAVLDTETVSSFNGGRYTVWQITGHVTITVTQTGQTNAVVSGLFFDSGTGNGPPSVTLTSPSNGGDYVAPATIALSATANASAGRAAGGVLCGDDADCDEREHGQSVCGELGERGDRDLHADGQGV